MVQTRARLKIDHGRLVCGVCGWFELFETGILSDRVDRLFGPRYPEGAFTGLGFEWFVLMYLPDSSRDSRLGTLLARSSSSRPCPITTVSQPNLPQHRHHQYGPFSDSQVPTYLLPHFFSNFKAGQVRLCYLHFPRSLTLPGGSEMRCYSEERAHSLCSASAAAARPV